MKTKQARKARNGADNANHHLWDNHGTFWCHFTLHLPD